MYINIRCCNINRFHILILSDISYGSCVELEGTIAKSIGPKQPVELLASNIKVLGNCDTEVLLF